MPLFECRVSRIHFSDGLNVRLARESVRVEAENEREAMNKARHPANWLNTTGLIQQHDKSSVLLTVEKCRRLADGEVQYLRAAGISAQ
jgi:hypothetical protein